MSSSQGILSLTLRGVLLPLFALLGSKGKEGNKKMAVKA